MSVMITILTLAPLLAPSAGSLVLAVSGWRAIFWITAAIGLFVLCSGMIAIRARPAEIAREEDVTFKFIESARHFLSTRQCLFGLALIALTAGSYLAFLTASPVIMSELFGVSPEAFGPLFSASALAFLVGASFSRLYVRRMGMMKIIRIGVICLLLSAALFTSLLLANGMTVFLFWFSAAFYMLGFGVLGPSATSIALDPVPNMAGRAAAILGTVQLLTGMLFSLLVALLYDGTMNILVGLIVISAVSAVWIAFSYRYP
jgi:DHA1 family bicyclomycin/chloramphenicol resistance-like MFS transporter